MSAAQIIRRLALQPHPEGGWYRETYRHTGDDGSRGDVTAIYYLLQKGEKSAWHRIDALEMWHWYAGSPLLLKMTRTGENLRQVKLGGNVLAGEEPQAVVEKGVWQSAEPMGDWVLVGCTVAPAFSFEGFEMAPKGWEP